MHKTIKYLLYFLGKLFKKFYVARMYDHIDYYDENEDILVSTNKKAAMFSVTKSTAA